MKKNKIKKIITISAVVLLMIATLGTFAAFFGKSDFAKIKDKWNETFPKEEVVVASNNILKNSDFTINTTEIAVFDETNCTSTSNALVDNWRLSPVLCEDFTIYQTSDGLRCINEDTENALYIRQNFEDGPEVFANKKVTFTVSIDNVVYSVTGSVDLGEVVNVDIKDNTAMLQISLDRDTMLFSVMVRVNKSSDIVFNWAQLEFGEVFTGYSSSTVA